MSFYPCRGGGGKIKHVTKSFNIERTYKPYTKQIDVSLKG